jgi:DNA-binding NtrC family response regulator
MPSPLVAHGYTPPAPLVDTAGVSPVERTRFRNLILSPLRAGLLRHLHSRPDEAFEVDALVRAFARLRVDVENCLQELVAHGFAHRVPGARARHMALRPAETTLRRLLDEFLIANPGVTLEDQSAAMARFKEIIGEDERMLLVLESIRMVAKTDTPVLILGATGSGKEAAARAIHELSRRRRDHSFQAVNCAALPEGLFESEVFGCEKSPAGAPQDERPGRIELASRGTLFLDEVTALNAVLQAKLVRALADQKVERVGSRLGLDVDVRLVSATSSPVDTFVANNRFREDLYHRLNAFTVRLPSLGERPRDIPILAERLLAKFCTAQGLRSDSKVFSPRALAALSRHGWPGNVGELVATVSRAALSARDRVVDTEDVQFLRAQGPNGAATSGHGVVPLCEIERAHIQKVLDTVSWNKKMAARLLKISRETLYRKIRTFHLAPGAGPGSTS